MEELFTPQEVAEKLKVTPRAVYKWLKEGKLKGLKAGDLWRIPQSSLDAFLADTEEEEKS